MSMHIDRDTHVPENSFYNFASFGDAFGALGPRKYYHDVRLECSSLLTESNMERLEKACNEMEEKFKDAEINRKTIKLDEMIRKFHATVGPELLSELRKGLSYVLEELTSFDSSLPKVFTRDLHARLFGKQVERATGHYGGSLVWWMPSEFMSRDTQQHLNMSHYASYLSNAAAWMYRRKGLEPGTIHTLSVMLARGKEQDSEKDMDRINMALAVMAAEYMRMDGFQSRLTNSCFAWKSLDRGVLSRAKWDPKIVSLRAPVYRLLNRNQYRLNLADMVELAVDNRLVVDSGRQVEIEEREDVSSPALFGWDDSTSNERTGLCGCPTQMVEQSMTKLLPARTLAMKFGSATVPILVGRSHHGYPAMLLPADDKTMEFLVRLYGCELPTPLKPIPSEDRMAWSFFYRPETFMDVMKQIRRQMYFRGTSDRFVSTRDLKDKWLYVGTKDIGDYLPKADKTDMFVNEILFY